MSRGPGTIQRRILAVLHEEAMNEGLPVGELKARVGGDRSNLRRAIRCLQRRKSLEEISVGGERFVRLTFWGALTTMPLPEPEDPLTDLKARKARWAEEARERALKRERARRGPVRGA